jgi:hypothetical protein
MLYMIAGIVILLLLAQGYFFIRARRETGWVDRAFAIARDANADAAARFNGYDTVMSFIFGARGNKEMPIARVRYWMERAGYTSLDGVDALYAARGIAADTSAVRGILREIDAFMNDRTYTDRAGNIRKGGVTVYRDLHTRLVAAWEGMPRI